MEYELVVGLETHIELSTKSKIFCSCSTKFGGTPNTHCCPVCIGLPGTLPKLNKAVVQYAVKAGLAVNCTISNTSKMDRKNYVYPDLAKAYQISQFDYPLCRNGFLELSNGKQIRINRIHIEEDAGKLIHDNGDVYIDYNRGGVPLVEIVTEPDFRSADEVREYLEKLRLTMKYLGVSDCKMQEGSMRCDVNISVRKTGNLAFGVRTEIKNMNSLSFIVKAINSEFDRQIRTLESGGQIIQQTLRYNEATGRCEPMRDKEESDDYRYFREPDLPYVYISDEEINTIKKDIPELLDAKIQRYVTQYGISKTDAMQIVKYANIARLFEEMVSISNSPKLCVNVLFTHIFRYFEDDASKEISALPVTAQQIAEVVTMVDKGEISVNFIKKILEKMFETGKAFGELFNKNDFAAIESAELEQVIDKVLAENSKIIDDYRAGKTKAIGALIGMIMRETHGRADAKLAENIIKEKLK